MAQTAIQPNFTGPYKQELSELANLIDWLEAEHTMSFVKAGDDKVYAYGGKGYVLVLDESKWNGLIEFIGPKAAVSIKPGEGGKIEVAASGLDEKGVKQLLKDGIRELRSYYENRYWSTPQPA